MKLFQLTMAASATLLLVSACSDQDVANNQAATLNEAADANMMMGDPTNQLSDLEPLVEGEGPSEATPVAAEPATKPKATAAPKAATPKVAPAPAPKAPTPPPADPHAGHDMNNM